VSSAFIFLSSARTRNRGRQKPRPRRVVQTHTAAAAAAATAAGGTRTAAEEQGVARRLTAPARHGRPALAICQVVGVPVLLAALLRAEGRLLLGARALVVTRAPAPRAEGVVGAVAAEPALGVLARARSLALHPQVALLQQHLLLLLKLARRQDAVVEQLLGLAQALNEDGVHLRPRFPLPPLPGVGGKERKKRVRWKVAGPGERARE
jgi:hypothetical protein